MATLDIRKIQGESIEIRFDSTSDRITHYDNTIILSNIKDRNKRVSLCHKKDIDNLIKALQKAKELWC